MIIYHTIAEVREFVRQARDKGRSIGFVPTMGYLHEGHLELMRRAKEKCDCVIVSIFVNPTQFGPGEDLERYPRDLERDARLAEGAGVDAIFNPEAKEIYPPGYCTYVDVERITERLCGFSRPGHFRGVATVVTKLFNIVKPDQAFFGQKDAQQVLVIQRMAADLNMEVGIVTVPTVREAGWPGHEFTQCLPGCRAAAGGPGPFQEFKNGGGRGPGGRAECRENTAVGYRDDQSRAARGH